MSAPASALDAWKLDVAMGLLLPVAIAVAAPIIAVMLCVGVCMAAFYLGRGLLRLASGALS